MSKRAESVVLNSLAPMAMASCANFTCLALFSHCETATNYPCYLFRELRVLPNFN